MMRQLAFSVMAASLTLVWPSMAWPQADAKQATSEARTAYRAGDFSSARDLAAQATETDPDNPEVHLLLGQAYYQLGELDEAISAWRRTLKLAPEQPYAKQMLEALRGETGNVELQLKLADALLMHRQYASVLQVCNRLFTEQALRGPQLVRARMLWMETLARTGKYSDIPRTIENLRLLHPECIDMIQTQLLLGQAKLHGDEVAVSEGLSLLRELVSNHGDSPAAITASYELLVFDLRLGANAERANTLAQWVDQNPRHYLAGRGRDALLDVYLTLARQAGKPRAESELGSYDVKALEVARGVFSTDLRPSRADQLTNTLIDHIRMHYISQHAHSAAVRALETIEASPLPRKNRLAVLKALASSKFQLAAKWLDDTARIGHLPSTSQRGQLPDQLVTAVSAFEAVRTEFPAEPLWIDQANLAKRVRASAAGVLPSTRAKGLCGPDAWSLDIALPVVEAGADTAAVKSAIETIRAIIDGCAKETRSDARKLAVDLSSELLEAVSQEAPVWREVMSLYYTVAQDYAAFVFAENIKAGRAAENAQLSTVQVAYLKALNDHLAIETQHASVALKQLEEHLKPWLQHGHWDVAEAAYVALKDNLPEIERRRADLAIVNLWTARITREHDRLLATGLTVPRQLEPTLQKALLGCYELQAGLENEPETLAQIRAVADSVVVHYKMLQYDDVAEAALRVKSEVANDTADRYASFELVAFADERARRNLSRILGQYGASRKITLGPDFKGVIDDYLQFIAACPTDALATEAMQKLFAIGQLFERHRAHRVAAQAYSKIASFAAEVDVLSQSRPGASSTAERAAFAAANAINAEAREAFRKASADRKEDEAPPTSLSREYDEAITAYHGFIQMYPKSPLVAQATAQILAVGLEYANANAWDVVDTVYSDLLASSLPIRRPERLHLARGLGQLGRVMPDHARQALSLLTARGLQGPEDDGSSTMLADSRSSRSGGIISGGMATGNALPAARPGREAAGGPTAPSFTPPPVAAEPQASDSETLVEMPVDEAAANEADRDLQLLAMIRQQESSRAAQIAQLRDSSFNLAVNQRNAQNVIQQAQSQQAAAQNGAAAMMPVLSEAELARQAAAIEAAYGIFRDLRKQHPYSPTADQARGEILVMVGHWRSLGQWERAATLASRFLADHPTDSDLPTLRLEVARDRLAWASKALEPAMTKQKRLGTVLTRFNLARTELTDIVAAFTDHPAYQQQAQWEIAGSFLKQARVVASFGPTLARGQYVRAAKELRKVADTYPTHPRLGEIPQMLWTIATELEGRAYDEEAIVVWNELTIHDPMHALAQQAAMKIAQTYHTKLKRPLRAAEAYQELNFARGGNDSGLQNAIFQIGSGLKNQKRWVEALHVLETFVDSFPKHAQAGQALTMVGQIHQTNEAWKDAIAAYRRVIDEFENGQFVQEAKWSIAECTINLSQWAEATKAYRDFVTTYPKDSKVAEANRRIDVLKSLSRYQGLVDEESQRKAFDAQYQIAVIVSTQLSNRVKAIIEYRKVVAHWPTSHLADDALFEIGKTYVSLSETSKAREALLQVAQKYPTSPLADDALFAIGKTYEDEATSLVTVTRDTTLARNKEEAQRRAYEMSQSNRLRQQQVKTDRIANLKATGQGKKAAAEEAAFAANYGQFNDANVKLFAQKALQEVETLTATQLADRQDKINAALRKAVEAYARTAKVAAADKADEALLQMATIYDQRLKDSEAAMTTWLEIVRQFSGTSVAENASWRIAETYQRQRKYSEAIDAYKAFLRNYRGGPKAGDAQFAIAENYEHLGEWVNAMDSYTNYVTNFPEGPLVTKAKEQIAWIKTYRL